eukprot:Clim_evm86s128 gene=Clim_evmTU86s128
MLGVRQRLSGALKTLALSERQGMMHQMRCALTYSTMRSIVLPEKGVPASGYQIDENYKMPTLGAKDLLVKVQACGICHRDVLDRMGAFPFLRTPVIPGHEIAGTVKEIGPSVTDFKEGDHVVSLHWAACGECRGCIEKGSTACERASSTFLGITADGGYAEYCSLGQAGWVKVPDDAPFTSTEAATIQCTFGTVWSAAFVKGALKRGETILVSGASGGVGTAAVQMAKAYGCRVVATSTSESKTDYLRELGADLVVVEPSGNFHKRPEIKEAAVDMAFDAVGGPTFGACLRSVRKGGRVVLIGNVTVGEATIKLGYIILNRITIMGSDSCTRGELEDCMEFMIKHNIKPKPGKTYPLNEVTTAHEELESKRSTGRLVLQVDPEAKW